MDELANRMVMVHPKLTHDPVHKQGQTGIITNMVYENDEVYVRFEDHTIGLYSSDALLVLQPPPLIQENLRAGIYGADRLGRKDAMDILDIYVLQVSGNIRKGLEVAISNETAQSYTLLSLKDWIDRGYRNETGREPAVGR